MAQFQHTRAEVSAQSEIDEALIAFHLKCLHPEQPHLSLVAKQVFTPDAHSFAPRGVMLDEIAIVFFCSSNHRIVRLTGKVDPSLDVFRHRERVKDAARVRIHFDRQVDCPTLLVRQYRGSIARYNFRLVGCERSRHHHNDPVIVRARLAPDCAFSRTL